MLCIERGVLISGVNLHYKSIFGTQESVINSFPAKGTLICQYQTEESMSDFIVTPNIQTTFKFTFN